MVLAGDEGFEPPNGGTRTHCLTTWRIPIRIDILYHKNAKMHIYYSLLNASTGSFFEAERAGIKPPIRVSTTLSTISPIAVLMASVADKGISPVK